jgi:hypothetical protein
VSVLLIYVFIQVFTVFCTAFVYCLVYVYLLLFVLSVLVWGLLAASDNSTAVTTSSGSSSNSIIIIIISSSGSIKITINLDIELVQDIKEVHWEILHHQYVTNTSPIRHQHNCPDVDKRYKNFQTKWQSTNITATFYVWNLDVCRFVCFWHQNSTKLPRHCAVCLQNFHK